MRVNVIVETAGLAAKVRTVVKRAMVRQPTPQRPRPIHGLPRTSNLGQSPEIRELVTNPFDDQGGASRGDMVPPNRSRNR